MIDIENILVKTKEFENLSRSEILENIGDYGAPRYADSPSQIERKRVGESIWRKFCEDVAEYICPNRQKGGSKITNTVIEAGLSSFVSSIAPILAGAAIFVTVTSAVAAGLLVLLYKELQKGIDKFCITYLIEDL